MSARFDWYQGTVQAAARDVVAGLAEEVAGPGRDVEYRERAPHGYAQAARVVDGEGLVAQVWWGDKHAYPHVVSSGETAQAVAGFLRSRYAGKHGVSRADACIDYAAPGAYDKLQGIALDVARECRVKVGTAGDHLLTKEGRTVYIGSRSSHTMCRIYDKAHEQRQKLQHDPVALLTVPEHLARLECQVRPKDGKAKIAASVAHPMQLMGSAAWMRELVHRVEGIELEPFQAGQVWRQSDDTRAYNAMLAQYGGVLRRRMEEAGSWECLGSQLGHDLEEAEQAKRRGRGGS